MKKYQIFGILLMSIATINIAAWRSYPIKEIHNNECTTNTLPCTYSLPRIENANYLDYKDNKLYRETYSMLRSTTYYDGRDMGLWGHQGIDIATDKGTPVYATNEGEVVFAEEKWWRGKTITIKHIQDGKTIYTSYSHLSEILVKVGNMVTENTIIGKVGSTGNSTWPHLHFQIEINNDNNHPFFYRYCSWDTKEIVNEARCEKQMIENTVDPILFIEKNGDIPILKNREDKNTFSNNYSNYKNIVFSGFQWGIINKNTITKIGVEPKIKKDELFILDKPIKIRYNKDIIKVFPDSFEVIKNKQLLILPQKEWITILSFSYDNKIFKRIPIIVADQKFFQQIKNSLTKNPTLLKNLFQD